MALLKIEDGILQRADPEELKKDNSWYRLTTPDGEHTVIDYDKDKARPLVKAILNHITAFLEIRLLRIVIVLQIIALVLSVSGKFGEKPASKSEMEAFLSGALERTKTETLPPAFRAVKTPSDSSGSVSISEQ